jgi:hypothetical protein
LLARIAEQPLLAHIAGTDFWLIRYLYQVNEIVISVMSVVALITHPF